MKRNRFTEEQIIGILKEHELGAKTADLCRKHGMSEATLYNWKAKFGGMEVSEAKRLRSLEDENRKLKKLLAEAMLDQAALKELLAKKWWGSPMPAEQSPPGSPITTPTAPTRRWRIEPRRHLPPNSPQPVLALRSSMAPRSNR
jgi:putative transposase